MQVPGADSMSADCDSVISALEFHPAPDDLPEISRREEEFGGKAGFTSISGCSSSSSHSTLSVDAANEQQEETKRFHPEEREQISSLKEESSRHYGGRYGPRNLLKASKRVTGRASRTVYTKPSLASKKRERFPAPSADEVDEFLGELEANMDKVQHKKFMESYNFDVVNELPLPGRFEWVKVEGGDHAA